VRSEQLGTGNIHWLLSVSARHPLVGGVAANAWWVALLIGAVGSLLLAIVVEFGNPPRIQMVLWLCRPVCLKTVTYRGLYNSAYDKFGGGHLGANLEFF